MHICFIVEGYPYPNDPQMPFIKQLVVELTRQGITSTVIAPASISRTLIHHVPLRQKKWIDNEKGVNITIFQPRYLSLSSFFTSFNRWLFSAAVKKAYKKTKNVDVLYAHFWHMAMVADQIDKNMPLFLACGESNISVCERYGRPAIKKMIERLNGVIYVGTKSYNEAKDLQLQQNQPYIIAPNGYDEGVFFVKDKQSCRKELGWDNNAFVVLFVGSFIYRKGVNTLCDALELVKRKGLNCKACFVGDGPLKPYYSDTLYCGKVNHQNLTTYLNASDVFVLPTQNEGCCNAIIEALACGLPVISSNQSFNDDILDESNSIRIDPLSPEEIADAIQLLFQNKEKRAELAKNAMIKANQLRISFRASRILHFIEKNCSKQTW